MGERTSERPTATAISPEAPERVEHAANGRRPHPLADGGDPSECPACTASSGLCPFHAGWTQGWDACVAFMAESTAGQNGVDDG
jgi:hypothetical protein